VVGRAAARLRSECCSKWHHRYVSRSTKWIIVHDGNGDAATFTAPNVVLHVVRLPNGWIVDSGSYCR
jgi:hypothetical protein